MSVIGKSNRLQRVNLFSQQKRQQKDSGFGSPTASRKCSVASNDPEEGTSTDDADASVVMLLPEVIEMDVAEDEENDDVVDESFNAERKVKEGITRRSRLVLKEGKVGIIFIMSFAVFEFSMMKM